MQGENTVKKEIKRMKELNKIDGLIGAKDVGAIIDSYNQSVDKKKEKEYNEDISDRNKYFYKLWLAAIKDYTSGERYFPKKTKSTHSTPDKIYLPNGETKQL